jgi:SnoaL-like domain
MLSAFLRIRLRWAIAALLLLAVGFAIGFIACLQDQRTTFDSVRIRSAAIEGDAPSQVRSGVLAALQAFQAGYARRDSTAAEPFAHALFVSDADLLVLGTDESEWVRGYPAVVQFIQNDWQNWGDLRINLGGPIINSVQDVAWLTTAGEVRFGSSARPIRFSAVLIRQGDDWRFRQVQFQWDDREPAPSDLLHPETYLTMLRVALWKIAPRSAAGASIPASSN